jgi:hypothetical protein
MQLNHLEMGLEEIRKLKSASGMPKPKKKYVIPKKSAKRIKQDILAKGDDKALDLWFDERRNDMDGKCHHCGGKSCKKDDKYFKFSIAHILPKAYFPSVATHPLNFIELCFWETNCHANMDNKVLDLTEMNCWDEIVEKFVAMYPFIDKKERRRIPQVLMNYIEIDI